jgi:hypothetical protein
MSVFITINRKASTPEQIWIIDQLQVHEFVYLYLSSSTVSSVRSKSCCALLSPHGVVLIPLLDFQSRVFFKPYKWDYCVCLSVCLSVPTAI